MRKLCIKLSLIVGLVILGLSISTPKPILATVNDQVTLSATDKRQTLNQLQTQSPDVLTTLRQTLAQVVFDFVVKSTGQYQQKQLLNAYGLGSLYTGYLQSQVATPNNISAVYRDDSLMYERYFANSQKWIEQVTKEDWWQPYNDAYGAGRVHAYYIANPEKAAKTAIVVHGMWIDAENFAVAGKMFFDLGYNVLLVDQRGAGKSSGSQFDLGYYGASDVAKWTHQVDERNGQASQIVLYGESMGASTVIKASGLPDVSKNVVGVVSDSGFANLGQVVRSLIDSIGTQLEQATNSPELVAKIKAVFAPEAFMQALNQIAEANLGFSFDDHQPVQQLAQNKTPLLVIDAEDDTLIPYEQSIALYRASAAVDKQLWLLPGIIGGHTNSRRYFKPYMAQLKEFTNRTFTKQKISASLADFYQESATFAAKDRTLYADSTLRLRDTVLRQAQLQELGLENGHFDAAASVRGLKSLDTSTTPQALQINDGLTLSESHKLATSTGDFSNFGKQKDLRYLVNVKQSGVYRLVVTLTGKWAWWSWNNQLLLEKITSNYGQPFKTLIGQTSFAPSAGANQTVTLAVPLVAGDNQIALVSGSDAMIINQLELMK